MYVQYAHVWDTIHCATGDVCMYSMLTSGILFIVLQVMYVCAYV